MPDLCICLPWFRQHNLFIYLFEKALLWRNDSYFSQKERFEVKIKYLNDGFIAYKHNCLASYSDGTHSLQEIHWWENDVMLNFSKSVPKCFYLHRHLGWPKFFFFWLNYSKSDNPIPSFYGLLVPKHTMSPLFPVIAHLSEVKTFEVIKGLDGVPTTPQVNKTTRLQDLCFKLGFELIIDRVCQCVSHASGLDC